MQTFHRTKGIGHNNLTGRMIQWQTCMLERLSQRLSLKRNYRVRGIKTSKLKLEALQFQVSLPRWVKTKGQFMPGRQSWPRTHLIRVQGHRSWLVLTTPVRVPMLHLIAQLGFEHVENRESCNTRPYTRKAYCRRCVYTVPYYTASPK